MFLSKVMNNAVEIIVPHIKTKVEKLAEEWKCIQSFYNSSKNKDFSKSKFFSKELSNHLENMIRYIKEEDIRIRMSSNHLANRHCIDFILENNVLLCLVNYANNDSFIRIEVVKFFTHFVTCIQPLLLSAMHNPLEQLISLLCEIYEDDIILKQELVKLIHVVIRHVIILPELVVLYFKNDKDKTEFPMFSILLNYINIPGQIGRVSREALSMIILLCKDDKCFCSFLLNEAQFFESLNFQLKIAFAALPNTNSLIVITNANNTNPLTNWKFPKKQGFDSGRNSRRNSGHQIDNKQYSDSVNSNSSNQINSDTEQFNTSSEATIEEFFELWAFVNKICEMDCETIIPKLVDVIINGFFKHSIIPALLSPMDDQATAATSYLTEIIKSIKFYPILDRILALLLGTSLDPEIAPDELSQQYMDAKKTTQMASLREILIERGASSEDRLSLATLKLFNSILESFNQFGLYNLVFRNLTDLDTIMNDNSIKYLPYDKKNSKALLHRLLSLMPQENQPSTPTSISLVVELAKKLDDEFGYEDYFLDAQSQVQMVSLACEHWSNPYPTIPSSPSSSNTKVRNKFFDGIFITMIFEQLESFLEMPMERNLVLTNIISKLACIPDKRIDWLLYGGFRSNDDVSSNINDIHSSLKLNDRKCLVDILEKIASDAKLGASKVPNFQTRIQLAKRRGMSSSARMSFHRSSRSTSISSSTPVSPIFTSPTHSRTPSTVSSKKSIELTSIYSLTSEPTSAHYKDNTINPFAKFTNFVNAFIVLQEFCKELAAILYVKYMYNDKDVTIIEEEIIKNNFDNQEVRFNDDSSNINNINYQVKNNTLNDDVLLMRNSENFAKLVRDTMSEVI
ncbi:Retinoic acid induced 16-like protein [Gigaspora rosea]|uniref:Retinoic acid induced 16-like protein n=1 Tax=Gigaspora rosea TaxID=44941 RepID=A0A397VIR4_9GLOM|nr:Retinoic acid induced 16-like protein [Gigaspora rosea]